MLWQTFILPKSNQPDLDARRVGSEIDELKIGNKAEVHSARGYLLEGNLDRAAVERIAREILADPVIEDFAIADASGELNGGLGTERTARFETLAAATVLLKPGVMDPVAQSVEQAIQQLGIGIDQVRTFRRYWVSRIDQPEIRNRIAARVLANDAIEQVVWGPLRLEHLAHGSQYRFELVRIPIRTMTETELDRVSRDGQLSLSRTEMRTIQRHFREQGRDPTDAELETIAQTWSEHCSHKTLRGRIEYEELEAGGSVARRIVFENLLKETIFKATMDIRTSLGPDRDWCVSVFEDNAGVVRFDEQFNVCFKVETHNHPSAIEPYGGANTGLGGVLRDSMGTGLGAKPIANTDVFCFAPPDTATDRTPPGVLHPKRVMRGVVAGVRDYGNRMGIPTVNGAIYFDRRYLGNPLVFCGNVGLIPRDRSKKDPRPGDLIVAIGGRTGRDGIHGATFSSIELTHESDELSGGAVQIGNAITEKMMLDVILEARDRGLYHAITDCGAGGFSSAVGEMGESIGAEVCLDHVPLKYQGLSYTEIWISEAQERMVLAVPPSSWAEFEALCTSEGVAATVIGTFVPTGRLALTYEGHVVGDLDMQFLHRGRPPVVRKATYSLAASPNPETGVGQSNRIAKSQAAPTGSLPNHSSSTGRFNSILHRMLSSWNVCSKEWVIRQYDHEVQGGSVVKPLVGAGNDGPSDAAVVRPVLGSHRGLAIACGMNPHYGDIDPYWMAASAIDEAVRNCVAVGANPDRIAILDNFCWGNTDRPEELGKLVRAALACRDIATQYGTPFISGKDSLNNEFKVPAEWRDRVRGGSDRIVIPATLLISAVGIVDDVRQCVTMDLKEPGNELYLIGITCDELGGSHYSLVTGERFDQLPKLESMTALETHRRIYRAIQNGWIRACHDLSEGGLAVALAEMAIAGRLGADVDLSREAQAEGAPLIDPVRGLFAESNARYVVEVSPDHSREFCALLALNPRVALQRIGVVAAEPKLTIRESRANASELLIDERIDALRDAWQQPLRW